jgi:hypothetical protein
VFQDETLFPSNISRLQQDFGKRIALPISMKLLIVALFSIFSLKSLALVKPMSDIAPPGFSKNLKQNSFAVKKVIPTNIQPTSDEQLVLSKILDHSVKNLLKSDVLKKSKFGRSVKKAEQSLQADVKIKSGTKSDQINHQFSFNFDAFQGVSNIQYSGFLNASLQNFSRDGKTSLNFIKKVDSKSKIIFQSNILKDSQNNRILFRTSW